MKDWKLTLLIAAGALLAALRIRSNWLSAQLGKEIEKNRRLEADTAAHERLNHAELGIGASDADNIRWLRGAANKLDGDRPAEKASRGTRKGTGGRRRKPDAGDGA